MKENLCPRRMRQNWVILPVGSGVLTYQYPCTPVRVYGEMDRKFRREVSKTKECTERIVRTYGVGEQPFPKQLYRRLSP